MGLVGEPCRSFWFASKIFLLQAKKIAVVIPVVILWFICASKALKQNLRQTKLNNMKTLIKSAIFGLALAGVAHAMASSYVTENATQNVKTGNMPFTFSQFNSSLGTLSAVDLILASSVPGGSMKATNNEGILMKVDNFTTSLHLLANSTLGLTSYTGTPITITTSPDWNTTIVPGNSNQTFTISGGQSLIGGVPLNKSISSSAFSQYLGSGTVTFNSKIINSITATADDYGINTGSYFSATTMTLRYTYTPASPSPVPEPGQVAASLLLLGGIGGYVFIKRRRKQAVAAA